MNKRTTAILFILIATIILLANAVVPHHHHNKEICIESSHCQTNSKSNVQEITEHNHKHDGNKESEYCLLKKTFLLPPNTLRQECKYFVYIENHPSFDDFQTAFLNYEFKKFVANLATNDPVPIIAFSYSHYLNTSLGLRAPPTT